MKGGIAILDFGSQFTQLIARRLRQIGVYTELYPFNADINKIKKQEPKGIILSGGPNSVNDLDAPLRDVAELSEICPILGICYGMQLIAKVYGGMVASAPQREYGLNEIEWSKGIAGVPGKQKVWMSHGDTIEVPPPGFEVVARSQTGHIAAMVDKNIWAIQFHPEVSHTEQGIEILSTFAFDVCKARNDWLIPNIAHELMRDIQGKVGPNEKVLCALSGGVDSTVVAVLLTRALGRNRVQCMFINNGLLRLN